MSTTPGIKRRKLRKRKRRPQKTRINNDEITDLESRNRRRQSLDKVDQIWNVMELESINKPYTRRRLTPEYYPNDQTPLIETTTIFYQETRKPYKEFDDSDEKVKSRDVNKNFTPDLKTVLKKSEGTLSLSEILQQKNLTLSDLLKGGSKAITALTQATDIKNKVNNKKLQERNFDLNHVTTTNVFDLLETTTNYVKYDETFKKVKNKLPITSAKLHKITPKRTTEKSLIENVGIPPKAVQININDIIGFSEILSKKNTEIKQEKDSNNGPLKMVIDLEKVINAQNSSKIHTSSTETPTTKYVQNKLKLKTAKEEILDFVNDKVNKENISLILESRNMTLEELIQLRERGSKQKHLLDIFRNKTETTSDLNDETYLEKVKNFFQSTPLVTIRRPKHIEISTEKHKTTIKELFKNAYSVTTFPVYKIEAKDIKSNKVPLPFLKSVYPTTVETFQNNNNGELKNIFDNVDGRRFDDLDNKLNSIVNDKLNVDVEDNLIVNEDDDDDFFNWPTGVKSALYASLIIIGASLMIFLSILIIFKLSQKTKRKLCYRRNFSENKIKTPILNDRPKRTIRTIMCDTLGRKKNNYYQTKQSMSDTIWDNNRIPFQ